MKKSIAIATLAGAVFVANAAAVHAQGMMLDYAADRVIQKCTDIDL